MTASRQKTVGFGCPDTPDPHHILVEIPGGRAGVVVIREHYGIRTGINGLPEMVDRCELPRAAWNAIAEDVKREFNDRLRSRGLEPGRWTVGPNKVERLLGKELLVLAWAVEQCDPGLYGNAVRNWTGLRPEERWWLFTMTAAATGRTQDFGIGWRMALRYALTENPMADPMEGRAIRPRPVVRRRSRAEDAPTPRFPAFDGEDSIFASNGEGSLVRGGEADR